MPVYEYKAYDGSGKVVSGIIDAGTPKEARARLLAADIRQGILASAVVDLPGCGRGFAYEVDGLGHALATSFSRVTPKVAAAGPS